MEEHKSKGGRMDQHGSRYGAVYAQWRADPGAFWLDQARAVDWVEPPRLAFDPAQGPYGSWFPDATCNTCWNVLDRHVQAGHGSRIAVIHDSPVTGSKRTLTYAAMLEEVQAAALALQAVGVGKGDRVIIYMPMIPEALVAMFACARLGAVHSVVFGGFAARELATRIDDAEPVAVVTASCGIEPSRVVAYKPLLDEAIGLAAHKPAACLVVQRPQLEAALTPGRDQDWAAALGAQRGRACPCTPVAATDPLYILYTSGTTGKPKGVVRDNGGHLVALAWSIGAIFGIGPGQVIWTASDVGWVVGHTYIVYAPLLVGATTVLYEGKPVGTPDAGAFWRVCAEHRVTVLFTAPTALRAIRKADAEAALMAGHDLSALEALYLAGERADPETLRWAQGILGLPVIDHWWQTESGWPIAANPRGLGLLPFRAGSPTAPMPGFDPAVLDASGRAVAAGEMGTIALRLPLPPGAAPTLWRADERFRTAYLDEFPGWYSTSDAGFIDSDGYLFVMGRTDDVINVAGHRLSTGALEEAVALHPDVAECAVIGVADALKGEVPCAFVVLKDGGAGSALGRPEAEVAAEVVRVVRDAIGPVAALQRVHVVERLPKTRSGKILRGIMKRIVQAEPYVSPPTIEDPAALDVIARAVR